jgi:hypothetical protein
VPTRPLIRRKIKYPKVYGYTFSPTDAYKRAVEDGLATEDQFDAAVDRYMIRLANHCGIKYEDIITVVHRRGPTTPVYCVVAATNASKRSRIPRKDIIEKAKEFLGTTEEPKWYIVDDI